MLLKNLGVFKCSNSYNFIIIQVAGGIYMILRKKYLNTTTRILEGALQLILVVEYLKDGSLDINI